MEEHVTTAYIRVPFKFKLLPNKKTTLWMKHHSDDVKTHMFHSSDMRNFTLTQNAPWHSRRGMGKRTGDSKSALPQKTRKIGWYRDPSPFWGGFICEAEATVTAGISDGSIANTSSFYVFQCVSVWYSKFKKHSCSLSCGKRKCVYGFQEDVSVYINYVGLKDFIV